MPPVNTSIPAFNATDNVPRCPHAGVCVAQPGAAAGVPVVGPASLPPAGATKATLWHEDEGLMRRLTVRALDPAYLELVVPVFRIAQVAIDAEGRQLGETQVVPSALRVDVPTQWRACDYRGERGLGLWPMNTSALDSLLTHWAPAMSLLRVVRASYVNRFPAAALRMTLGDVHRLASLLQAVPAYGLMRRDERIDNGELHPVWSTLFRAAEGVRLAVQHMLCGHGGDAPLPAHQTVGADTVLDFVRRHRLFHSAHAVCAGPAALIDEFLQVLIEGRPASNGQAVVLDPVLTEELQHLGAALDYGLRALMAYATTRALEAVWQREAHRLGELAAGWRGRRTPQVVTWQQRMQRCHESLDARSAATLTASLQTPLAAATELYSACARGLNALAETDALRAAVITPAAAPAGRKVAELSAVFAQRLGLLPGEAAAELRLLVTGVLTLLATTRAVVAVARDTQAGIQHLLGRAPARRPLQASDLELHDHLFGEPQPRPPQLPAELEAMFGIGLRVSAERIEIDTPRDGPPGEGFVPRSETRTAMREAVAA